MLESETSAAAPPGSIPGGAPVTPALEPTELQVINGGIEIEVVKIDGSSETVKVRQLPISIIGEWGTNQGSENEAYLIELLCDRIDRTTAYHLQNERMIEMRVLQILQQADFKQIEAIEQRLIQVRDTIARHEAKERWSDTITHESAAEIRELGKQLNKKKYVDQVQRSATASKALLAALPQSQEQSSSSPSQTSRESPGET